MIKQGTTSMSKWFTHVPRCVWSLNPWLAKFDGTVTNGLRDKRISVDFRFANSCTLCCCSLASWPVGLTWLAPFPRNEDAKNSTYPRTEPSSSRFKANAKAEYPDLGGKTAY